MIEINRKHFIFPIILSIIVFLLFYLPILIYGLAIQNATLYISGDDGFSAYINGNLVYSTGIILSGQPWDVVYDLNVASFLPKCGPYVLAINYFDTMGTETRITYKLLINMDNGTSIVAYSNGNSETKQLYVGNTLNGTSNPPTGWNTINYDDSAWTETVYTCDSSQQTYNSIADPVFNGATYNGYVPYIGDQSGCGVYATGDSNLVRQYFSVPCAPVSITKTISTNFATLGQTITYCFNYFNYDVDAHTFNLWDTIPSVTTFSGCNSGCVTQTSGAYTVVSWSLSAASNTGGQVCFWVIASSYPFLEIPPGEVFAFIKDKNLGTDDKFIRR